MTGVHHWKSFRDHQIRQQKVCTLKIFSWNHFLEFKEAKMTLHHPSPTSGPHLLWSLAARDFLVDAGVRVPCSIRWNSPSCSWFPASFLPNRFSNHGSGWSNANISRDIPKQIQNTHFHVCLFWIYLYLLTSLKQKSCARTYRSQMMWAHLWLSPSKRKPSQPPGGSPRIAPEQVRWSNGPVCRGTGVKPRHEKVIRFAWDMVRGDPLEWRKTEMWRVIILSVTEKVTEISASKCLICWSRSFRQVGFLASFWRSWFFYLSQWPSEPPSGHTSLRPAQVEPATLAANGNLPRGTTSFCKLASGKLT